MSVIFTFLLLEGGMAQSMRSRYKLYGERIQLCKRQGTTRACIVKESSAITESEQDIGDEKYDKYTKMKMLEKSETE